jgi:hypothetical protein
MTDPTFDCKACRAIANPAVPNLVWQNELWLLRHTGAPYAELGWMTLHSRRHAPALTLLTDEELADFGPTAKRICEAIMAATGALRVYEGGPKGWDTILLKAKPGTRNVAEADVERVIREVGQLLSR